MKAVLGAYYKAVRQIYQDVMSPDDFSFEDMIGMIQDVLQNPEEYKEEEDEE